ncbi:MAG TPA: D-glycero-beta-D-manno-heptose-7-phosphate kinase [Gemmatimonadales bacterium]|jgi:D-beta-D-heptose 7-phosphate kinase/D-beta-D-heptose 1-phosphate adenosyltransferase
MLQRERVIALLDAMRHRRIVVIGDAMLDIYLIGDVERISPEAPVPVVAVHDRKYAMGGAANVAANVAAIGADVTLVAAVGDDRRGEQLRTELAAAGIRDDGVIVVPDRPTTSKTRVVARNQQLVRIDEEEAALVDGDAHGDLLHRLKQCVRSTDAVLLEDYNKGVLTPNIIAEAIGLARRRGVPTVVDPKYKHFFDYKGATVFKPNRRELEAALGATVDLEHADALPAVMAKLEVDNLLLTLGPLGMALLDHNGAITRMPTQAREVYDVSGAGDTVTAWVGTALAAGATVIEAAELANYAAGIEVGKAGVAVVSPEEVLRLYERTYDEVGLFRRGGVL